MLKILHVSDTHFGATDDLGEQNVITEALLEAAHKDGIKPDICIFTGDLAHSGERDQFDKGGDWLRRLVEPWGIDILVVPGNHDITRRNAKRPLLRTICGNEQAFHAWRDTATAPHLSSYFDWHKSFAVNAPLKGEWTSLFTFRHDLEGGDLPIHFIGLNSSFFACGDDDKGNLAIDIKSLNKELLAAREKPGLVVALAHHPLDHLAEWNGKEVGQLLRQERGAHLLLHGHMHDQAGRGESNTTGSGLTTLRAGASYQGSRWPQHFAFYELDFSCHELNTTAYRFSKNSGEWIQDPEISRTIIVDIPFIPSVAQPDGKPVDQLATNLVIELPRKPVGKPVGHHADQAVPPERGPEDPQPGQGAGGDEDQDDPRTENDARKYREAAQWVEQRVVAYVKDTPRIASVCYATNSRIKATRRIVEKVRQRRLSGVCDVVDICGARLVTYFLSDIPAIIDELLRAVEGEAPLTSPFTLNSKVEIRVHTSRHENDPLSVTQAVQDVARRSRLKPVVRPMPQSTGYSSVHLIARAPTRPGESDIKDMFLEIQIRSASEELWGAIDHRLRYGINRGTTGVSWQRHLNVLKAMVDGIMQYVDEIKRLSEESNVTPPSEIKAARSIAKPALQMRGLKDLPQDILVSLDAAFDLWKRADATQPTGGDPGLFRQAADAFGEILAKYGGQPESNAELASELSYVAEMERAYLLMYTGDLDELSKAASLYEGVLGRKEKDGTALFRLGQIRRRQGRFDESRTLLRQALRVVKGGDDWRLNADHWTYDELRLALALTEWRVFEVMNRSDPECRTALSAALGLAQDVLDNPVEHTVRIRALNDFLYYCWEERHNFDTRLIDDDQFAKLAVELRDAVSGREINYEYADTLQRAFKYLKRTDDMRAYALKLRDWLEQIVRLQKPNMVLPQDKDSYGWTVSLGRNLDPDQQESLAFAQDIINTNREQSARHAVAT